MQILHQHNYFGLGYDFFLNKNSYTDATLVWMQLYQYKGVPPSHTVIAISVQSIFMLI